MKLKATYAGHFLPRRTEDTPEFDASSFLSASLRLLTNRKLVLLTQLVSNFDPEHVHCHHARFICLSWTASYCLLSIACSRIHQKPASWEVTSWQQFAEVEAICKDHALLRTLKEPSPCMRNSLPAIAGLCVVRRRILSSSKWLNSLYPINNVELEIVKWELLGMSENIGI
jgi:hypothetical protein